MGPGAGINIFNYVPIILIVAAVVIAVFLLWLVGIRIMNKEEKKLEKYEDDLKPKMDVVEKLKEEYGIEDEKEDTEEE
ncbi:MAG: hypothetical protein KO217_03205 [Methanobacteriaceae archaeon]|jgi:hypothetical protein|nr:MAG: hypothetical protein CIT01_10505 [Methanobacterium sp. BRmetb2]MCC7557684.1 hypothetical protein [Methanobacteriaceae archaeon]